MLNSLSQSLLLAVTLAICFSSAEATHHERMSVHRRSPEDFTEHYLDTMPAVNDTMLAEVGNDMLDENAEGHMWKRAMGPAWTGKSVLRTNKLKSGVSAMQLTVTGLDSVL